MIPQMKALNEAIDSILSPSTRAEIDAMVERKNSDASRLRFLLDEQPPSELWRELAKLDDPQKARALIDSYIERADFDCRR